MCAVGLNPQSLALRVHDTCSDLWTCEGGSLPETAQKLHPAALSWSCSCSSESLGSCVGGELPPGTLHRACVTSPVLQNGLLKRSQETQFPWGGSDLFLRT